MLPKSENVIEHILNNFITLTNKYNYKIVSKENTENYVKICYENNKIERKVVIINDTNNAGFGFSIFMYNTENKKILCNLYSNIRVDMEDENCDFIKYSAKSFFKYNVEVINGSIWKSMDRPRMYVDFNEMVTYDIVLLSTQDSRMDSEGNIINFKENLPIHIYTDDSDENGNQDNLMANGIAIKYDLSQDKYWSHVKWCCKIDSNGIMHESDLQI
jgi:hypothetical protein